MTRIIKNKILPRHVFIIPDGNGRWAKQRSRCRIFGHHHGTITTLPAVLDFMLKQNIPVVTFFILSCENMNRNIREVTIIMKLLKLFAKLKLNWFIKNGINLTFIGNKSVIPADILEIMHHSELATIHGKNMKLNILINYSGQWDIIQALNKAHTEVGSNKIDIEYFSKHLSLSTFPAPDLVIRTGGENRISNSCLWDLAYTELFFLKKFWPDISKQDLHRAFNKFAKCERKFGIVEK